VVALQQPVVPFVRAEEVIDEGQVIDQELLDDGPERLRENLTALAQ